MIHSQDLPSRQPANMLGGPLDTLVENRVSLNHDVAELHLYETFDSASMVQLKFNAPVLTSMLSGRKIMHIDELPSFEYLPGESLLLPADKPMSIDFPDAAMHTPTRCIALTISTEFIQDTITYLNERFPRLEDRDQWQLSTNNYLFRNDQEMGSLIDKLIRLFREEGSFSPFFITLSLKELVVRLMQTQARTVLMNPDRQLANTHRLAFLADYIRNNLTRPLPVEELCRKACLSKSHFFRLFKNELGLTPTQFILNERINLAKKILADPGKSITDACYESGFNSLTHFSSSFRSIEKMSPRQYRQRIAT